MMRALDLFSAAAGGWSLGLHRAGFVTVAACEIVEWRRILYAENNSNVLIYEDVRSLTAGRLVSDLGFLPDIIVGSPPCQDISTANTKGKGIEGERSGLYLEAVRLVGDCRPRWFAFENSSNLRTRGADRLLDALAALGYACEPCVVGADNVGANHIRKRSWLIGFDPGQLTDTRFAIPAGWSPARRRLGSAQSDEGIGSVRPVPRAEVAHSDGDGRDEGRRGRRGGIDISIADDSRDAAQIGCGAGRPGGCTEPAPRPCQQARRDDAHPGEAERREDIVGRRDRIGAPDERRQGADRHAEPAPPCGSAADTDETRQAHGRMVSGLRAEEIPVDGRDHGRCDEIADPDRDRQPDGAVDAEMGGGAGAGVNASEPWPDWNGGLAHHLLLDDGLSAWVAGTRVAIGDGKRPSPASLIVEAFGDAVLPQIPEAIGRAIQRTEAALDTVLCHESPVAGAAHHSPGIEGGRSPQSTEREGKNVRT
jgi:DNA (cytosine-5)-methyltransferase 1